LDTDALGRAESARRVGVNENEEPAMKTQNAHGILFPTCSITIIILAAAYLPIARGDDIEEQTDPPPEQCTTLPTIVIERQVTTTALVRDGSIGIDRCAQFVIAFHDLYNTPFYSQQTHVRFLRYDADCTTQPYAGQDDGTPLTTNASVVCASDGSTVNSAVSIAMGLGTGGVSPPIYATFTGAIAQHILGNTPWRLSKGWTFDQASPPTPTSVPACGGPGDREWNTAGISDGASPSPPVRTSAWTRDGSGGAQTATIPPGLQAEKPTPTTLRACDPACFVARWAPSISTRFTGESVICWAEPEAPDQGDSPMNIFIAEYTSSGDLIPSSASVPGFQVNAVDPPFSQLSQESPAVAMVGDKIVVTWVAPDPAEPPGCAGSRRHIFAKVMSWNGTTGIPTTQKEDFRVDTDHFGVMDVNVSPNPTVAITLTLDPNEGAGRFIIAWNVVRIRNFGGVLVEIREVHAQ
jgi:hypothetical protein